MMLDVDAMQLRTGWPYCYSTATPGAAILLLLLACRHAHMPQLWCHSWFLLLLAEPITTSYIAYGAAYAHNV
jgi:hypothetical protein